MTDLIRIGAVFALIVVLLRHRWNLGMVMLLGSVLLGASYRIGPVRQAEVFGRSSLDPVTLNLIGGLVLIMVLENVIRKRGLLKLMTESLSRVARDRRISMAILPGVIGLLPSAGGAAFSAPMVQEAAGDIVLSPERRVFINYWFRHIWEYISPLYPGIVLAAAVTRIPLNDLLLSQLPLPIAVVVTGALFCFRGVGGHRMSSSRKKEDVRDLAISLLPILSSLVMVVVLHIPLAPTMAIIVISLFLLYRYPLREIGIALRESISVNVILMVIGIMAFKGMLDASGAIEALPRLFRASGLPPVAVFAALPFLVGILTGLTVGFVGSTFPIIVAMTGGHPDPGVITFAFASGFAGVMLSPTHLCYLLTVQYFHADLAATYRLLYVPVVLVFLTGLAKFLIS
jgi:integral membrane protein (TIGR00529 family)